MYYHVLIKTDETGEIFELDKTVLKEIIDNVVKPYFLNTEFQLKGYFIEPSKVKRLLITETEKDSSTLVKEKYRNLTPGVLVIITEEDCVFQNKELYKDITRSVMEEAKKNIQTESMKKGHTPKVQNKYNTIFLAYSYRTEDDEFVSGFKDLLIDKGYNVIDGKADRLGSISQAILDKIRVCDVTVIVMTKRDKKENCMYTTSAWLLEEKGAALALGKVVAMFVEEEIDENDIGGLQGDSQRFHFNRNNFLKVVMNFVKILET